MDGKKRDEENIGMDRKTSSEKLIQNLTDQIMEAQIKLGYAKETLRFYYPVSSLNALLGEQAKDATEMLHKLEENADFSDSVLGTLCFLIHEGRIEIGVPPEGAEYVYKKVKRPEFLSDLIALFMNHHACSLADIRNVFEKYGEPYVCKKMPDGMDFDYVLFFKEGSVDAYYYCIKEEMGHTIYHRFTKADYELLMEG